MVNSKNQRQTPNPAVVRDPKLVERAKIEFGRTVALLLDRLAARDLKKPDFRLAKNPYPLEDTVAAAQVLRVLAKPSWSSEDLQVFDAYFPTAARSEVFGDEFEEARHRIRSFVREGALQLAGSHVRGSGQVP